MNKPEDIKALDKKIQDFKKREKIENQDVSDEPEYSSAAAGFQISTELLAGIVIGLSIGYVLDKFFNTAPCICLGRAKMKLLENCKSTQK